MTTFYFGMVLRKRLLYGKIDIHAQDVSTCSALACPRPPMGASMSNEGDCFPTMPERKYHHPPLHKSSSLFWPTPIVFLKISTDFYTSATLSNGTRRYASALPVSTERSLDVFLTGDSVTPESAVRKVRYQAREKSFNGIVVALRLRAVLGAVKEEKSRRARACVFGLRRL